MSAEHFGVFSNDHALTMSWDGNGKPSFALTFKVRKAGRIGQLLNLSSQITRTEAYLPNQPEPAAVALRFGDLIEEQDFEMYLPRPNPWQSKTTLGFIFTRHVQGCAHRYRPNRQTNLAGGCTLRQGLPLHQSGRQPNSGNRRFFPATGNSIWFGDRENDPPVNLNYHGGMEGTEKNLLVLRLEVVGRVNDFHILH
ncbi:MAG: hypothetical protein H6574_17360 [Lewinellaceae bacterium]|nr:hypothetical protein [Lewinellaceae bacterium]